VHDGLNIGTHDFLVFERGDFIICGVGKIIIKDKEAK
jgi:hypothetical protein